MPDTGRSGEARGAMRSTASGEGGVSPSGAMKFVIIKLGGEVVDDGRYMRLCIDELAALGGRGDGVASSSDRYWPIVVHGGGKQISDMSGRLGMRPTFHNGLRMTSAPEMGVVEMVLAGSVNSVIVRALRRRGISAVGISGVSADMLRAEPMEDKGRGENCCESGNCASGDCGGEGCASESCVSGDCRGEGCASGDCKGEGCASGDCRGEGCASGNCAGGNCASGNCAGGNCGEGDSDAENCGEGGGCASGNCAGGNCTGENCATGDNFTAAAARCNPRLLFDLCPQYVPVVAPIGVAADGATYNVNADMAAVAIAQAVSAEALLFITDVPGVLDKKGAIIERLDYPLYQTLIANNVITGGMRAKLSACFGDRSPTERYGNQSPSEHRDDRPSEYYGNQSASEHLDDRQSERRDDPQAARRDDQQADGRTGSPRDIKKITVGMVQQDGDMLLLINQRRGTAVR